MTNRELLSEIKNVEPAFEHIKDVAEEIISNTCDSRINHVNYIDVREYYVIVGYEYACKGEWYNEEVKIPIEWFDEESDYVKEYEKMLRKTEAHRKHVEKARLKRIALFNSMYMQLFATEKTNYTKTLKEKKEYETYLKLKKKYENGDLA